MRIFSAKKSDRKGLNHNNGSDERLVDGKHLSEHIEAVRGTAENPMTRDEVVAKACDLMTPFLGALTCKNLIEKLLGLEDVRDIRELRPLLQRN